MFFRCAQANGRETKEHWAGGKKQEHRALQTGKLSQKKVVHHSSTIRSFFHSSSPNSIFSRLAHEVLSKLCIRCYGDNEV